MNASKVELQKSKKRVRIEEERSTNQIRKDEEEDFLDTKAQDDDNEDVKGDEEGEEEGEDEYEDEEEENVFGGASELAPEKLAAFLDAERAKGVVYLSSLPAYIKPLKVRHLLERIGEVGRIYLAPEDAATYHRRVKSGGSKRVCYKEGWVEFLDKHVAKAAAALLNGTSVGGAEKGAKKRGFFSSDIWCIKYLKHFKWHHLAEKANYEKRIKALELRNELAKARKQAERIVGQSERARKKRNKGAQGGSDEANQDMDARAAAEELQHSPLPDPQLLSLPSGKSSKKVIKKPGK
jgi:ESF2/ABP1 family protein